MSNVDKIPNWIIRGAIERNDFYFELAVNMALDITVQKPLTTWKESRS